MAGQDTSEVDYGLRKCGYLNQDDLVNIFDAFILLQMGVGLVQPAPTRIVLGDLDPFGSINVFNAIIEWQV